MKIRKRISKSFAWLLSCSMVMVNITPAFAATEYTNSTHAVENQTITNTDGTPETTVYAELGSEFKVTIPKKVTLDGETKTGKYQVSVEGDIAGNECVNVVPEETVSLTTKDKLSVTGSIEQDKIQWTYSEMLESNKVLGNGLISAQGITAGAWNGAFNFNIGLNKTENNLNKDKLTLSINNDVAIGINETMQVNAYVNGELANTEVSWKSDNKNITVTNGLIETTASTKVGDVATITVIANDEEKLSTVQTILSTLGVVTYANADEDISIEFTVTIVDIEYSVEEINLKPGDSQDVTAKIIPNTINGIVSWSTTAVSGLNLIKNGNTVTIKVANDMPIGTTYNLIANYGNYSKLLTINIIDGHTHNYQENVVDATCTKDGVKTYTCECGNTYTETIEKTGHSYESIITNPTCTNAGYTTYQCKNCESSYKDDYVSATGHVEINGGTAEIHTKCSVCNATISTKHNYTVETTKESTCTEVGTKKYTCECGYTYTEEIAVLGHNYTTEYTIDQEATCTVDGSKSQHCNRCESVQNVTTIPATGHSYTSSITKEATCTEAGNKHYECENCDYAYDEAIEAKGHVYDATKYVTDKAATCTTDGQKSVHCNICGAKIVGTEVTIPATGHSYDTGVVTTEATCTTAGVRTYTCSCGNSYTEEISALGHKYNGNNCERCGIEAVAGLYDKNDNLLCTWEESGIDSICSNADSIIANNYPTTTKVLISDSVKNIGHNAFRNCTSLTSVTIPSSVADIGLYAFWNCSNLTSVTIEEGVTHIGQDAFRDCTSLTSVTIPSSVASIGSYAFNGCTNLTSVTIEEGVTSIEQYAFNGCTSLTNITIPNSVTKIDAYAFNGCTSLTSVTIPSSVTYLGSYAFIGCTSLTNITIPNSVTSIGAYTFNGCTNLTSVTIPSSVTSIGHNAFYGCTSLTSVTIPSSVTYLGSYAFYNCTNLTSVTFKTTSGWYVGDSVGAKTTALSSSDLANKSTAATYLKSTYYTKYWTR